MLGTSRLLLGLLRETPEAVAAQVDLWDRSNVIQAAWEQASTRSETARDAGVAFREVIGKPLLNKLRVGLASKAPPLAASALADTRHSLDPYIRKFSMLANHARMRIKDEPDTTRLHDLGLSIEQDAVNTLREADNRSLTERLRGTPRSGFSGNSVDDLVRYIIQQTFKNLDAEFRQKSPDEQAEIAARIAAALRDLPPDEQERIRQAARLPDLTEETLRQAGVLASLGLGVSGLVGIAGFSAYTTLVSVVAGITGLVGIHLSFGVYTALTAGLAGLANPLFFVPAVLGGGAWLTNRANRSIRSMLYPTLVASSVMAHTAAEVPSQDVQELVRRIAELLPVIDSANDIRAAGLLHRFPELGNPPPFARLASHVAT
jgi:hypothetical protein